MPSDNGSCLHYGIYVRQLMIPGGKAIGVGVPTLGTKVRRPGYSWNC